MKKPQVSKHLELRWVTVVDASGRTRLEARWVSTDAPANAAHAA